MRNLEQRKEKDISIVFNSTAHTYTYIHAYMKNFLKDCVVQSQCSNVLEPRLRSVCVKRKFERKEKSNRERERERERLTSLREKIDFLT